MNKGQLSIQVNDEYLGVAFEDEELKTGPLWPAIALLHAAGCTLVTGRPAPSYFFVWETKFNIIINIIVYLIRYHSLRLFLLYWGAELDLGTNETYNEDQECCHKHNDRGVERECTSQETRESVMSPLNDRHLILFVYFSETVTLVVYNKTEDS